MQLTGKQLINNKFIAEGTGTFTGYTAQDNQPTPTRFFEATAAEIDQAVKLAETAFWVYRKKSGAERAAFLEAIADELLTLGEDLLSTAAAESGLPMGRIEGERGRIIGQLRGFAEFIRDDAWQNRISGPLQVVKQLNGEPGMLHQCQIALGPVAVFGASNFPLAFSVAGGDTVSALAAGCPVVFKAHPAHPATCELVGGAIGRATERANVPAGVFSLLQGAGNHVGEALVQHPLIKAVGFTGSFKGGKALYDLAVRRPEPIPVYAEMGSVNPVFFLPGAFDKDVSALAAAFAASVTQGVGQFCTNPGVFVLPGEQPDFINELTRQLTNIPCGPMLTAGIRDSYRQGIDRQRKLPAVTPGTDWPGAGIQPHLLLSHVANALHAPELTEEVFGPSTVGIVANSPEEMLSFARSLKGQLTATLFGTEADLLANTELIDVLTTKAGRLIVNGFPTGVEVSHAMVHGGPYPATTDSRTTSVGTQAIYRFSRPVCYQGFPAAVLPGTLSGQ